MSTQESKAVQTVENESTSPPALLQQAVQSGADVEVLERLMGLQERWEDNQARKAYDQAMAAIRADLPPIEKKVSVDYNKTHYKYERLQDVVEAVQPVLSEHGMSFRWKTDSSNGQVSVTCIISHEMGHSEKTKLSAPTDTSGNKNAIQRNAARAKFHKGLLLNKNCVMFIGDNEKKSMQGDTL